MYIYICACSVTQSCQTLCDHMDCSPPCSWVYGIFLGMSTGIGCHCLCLVTQSCPILYNPMDCSPPGPSVLEDSPGKNTGVGCHALLRAIFPTQELNPGLLHCRRILYLLSHQGSQAISYSRGSSQPRDRTRVSYISCIDRCILYTLPPGKPHICIYTYVYI